MRWRIFALYVAITVVLMAICASDFFFGKGEGRKLGVRLGLCLIWPLAGLSRAGRDLLFKSGAKL